VLKLQEDVSFWFCQSDIFISYQVPFYLPDKTSDIVAGHDPSICLGGGVGKLNTTIPKLCV